jgi:hypothetical protein
MEMLRSILAVLGGFAVTAVASLGTDGVLVALLPHTITETQPFPPALLAGILGYCCVYAILGGYVTGFIARRAEVRHALVLGGIALAIGITLTLPALQGQSSGPRMPGWFTAVTLADVVPATALGGYLRALQRRAHSAAVKKVA